MGGGLLAVLALACLGAPVICRVLGLEPEAVDLLAASMAPSWDHPMGTDDLGRDLLARLLWGGRVSLLVGLIGALAAAGIGTALGMVAGYRGGRLDALLMRLTDGIIALPMLPLLIVLAAVDPTKLGVPEAFARAPEMGVLRIVIIVALLGWTTTARLVRATTLSLKERDFVRAAQALGAGEGAILRRHILPNVLPVVSVAVTLAVGQVILLESALSFLGLGIQPPMPSWGNMLTGALETIWTAPWQAAWPGGLIFITVIAVTLLGDSLTERSKG
jgi:peptide/nickel transport system permease protein